MFVSLREFAMRLKGKVLISLDGDVVCLRKGLFLFVSKHKMLKKCYETRKLNIFKSNVRYRYLFITIYFTSWQYYSFAFGSACPKTPLAIKSSTSASANPSSSSTTCARTKTPWQYLLQSLLKVCTQRSLFSILCFWMVRLQVWPALELAPHLPPLVPLLFDLAPMLDSQHDSLPCFEGLYHTHKSHLHLS